METGKHLNKSRLELYLDWIIEEHTATPRNDPEILNYSCRPLKRETRETRAEQKTDIVLSAAD